MKVEVTVCIQQFWMQTVDQCNSILDLSLQDHLSDLNSFIKGIQVHTRLYTRLHPELLRCLLEALCGAESVVKTLHTQLIFIDNWKQTQSIK